MDQDYWNAAPFSSVYPQYSHAQYSFYPPAVDLTQQELNSDKEQDQDKNKTYSYDVKFINPNKKSDFVVRRWHDMTEVIQTTALLKVKLRESFPQDVSTATDFKLGYMQGIDLIHGTG